MQRVLITVAAAALVACGGSSSSGGASVSVTGAITGALSSAAGIAASGTCSFGGTSASFAVAGVNLSTADVCKAAQQGRDPAGATSVVLSVVKGNTAGQTATITPGVYTISSIPVPDAQGNVAVASADVFRSGSAQGASGLGCSSDAESLGASGTITITSISPSSIAGSVDVTLENGGKVQGSFSVTVCQLSSVHLDPTTCELSPLTLTCS